jgi:hypothetical protein
VVGVPGRLADSPDVPGNGRGVPVEEVLPQNFFATEDST